MFASAELARHHRSKGALPTQSKSRRTSCPWAGRTDRNEPQRFSFDCRGSPLPDGGKLRALRRPLSG